MKTGLNINSRPAACLPCLLYYYVCAMHPPPGSICAAGGKRRKRCLEVKSRIRKKEVGRGRSFRCGWKLEPVSHEQGSLFLQ